MIKATLNPTAAMLGTVVLASALAACDSGSSGGGSTANPFESEQGAALAAAAAASFVEMGRSFAADTEEGSDTLAQAQVSPQNADPNCNTGGSMLEQSGSATSKYAGLLSTEVTIADNCTFSHEGVMAGSTHGRVEYGEAEGGAVSYFKVSDLSGNPDADGRYTMQMTGFIEMETRMRALMHVCDGCASVGPGSFEMDAFLDGEFGFGGEHFAFRFGRSTAAPLIMQWTTVLPSTVDMRIDGHLAFSQTGSNCSFALEYETVQPLRTQGFGTENERIIAGEIGVSFDGGNSYTVEFLSDGSAFVNGRTYSESDFAELEQACG